MSFKSLFTEPVLISQHCPFTCSKSGAVSSVVLVLPFYHILKCGRKAYKCRDFFFILNICFAVNTTVLQISQIGGCVQSHQVWPSRLCTMNARGHHYQMNDSPGVGWCRICTAVRGSSAFPYPGLNSLILNFYSKEQFLLMHPGNYIH